MIELSQAEFPQEEGEVQVVGQRYAYLQDMRVLSWYELEVILYWSPRPFAACTTLQQQEDLPQLSLEPGRAFLLRQAYPTYQHCVALWRGYDGDFLFFDSYYPTAITPELEAFMKKEDNSGSSLYTMVWRVQDAEMGTCSMHCLAFLDKVTACPEIPTSYIPYLYPGYAGSDFEVQVVKNCEAILAEFPNSICLRSPRRWRRNHHYRLLQLVDLEDAIGRRVRRRHLRRCSRKAH